MAEQKPSEQIPDDGSDATVFRDPTLLRDADSVSMSDGVTSSWRNLEGQVASDAGAVTPRVLKHRFVLEERIGAGGMGTVYRAKDLRKVEARDSRPFIAVKVLNNDFRQHPEAFIALEREASKSQGLRHSNIVSIFDFDKDSDIPFITMELLEGTELAELLRAYPNGLPQEQAWQIIEGMVKGLAHAHEEGVVHADFKPGNVFVTKRSAKILDFGIARAMRMNHGGEDTDFDPARLAALTPAYASREMLNGDNPEPRDDLYSLGIVMYMILSGHHPYGRLPAHEAAQENLKPERIKSLSSRRWRILQQCLQFNRQARPPSAHDVYEGLFGKTVWHRWGIAAACAAVAVGALVFTFQEQAQLDDVKQEVRQEALVDAQMARIGALLQEPQFDETWQRTLFSEAQTLQSLGSQRPDSNSIAARIEQAYVEHVRELQDLSQAFAQLDIARRFGDMDQVSAVLQEKLLSRVDILSASAVDEQWLSEADITLGLANAHFPRSSELSIAREALVVHLQAELQRLIEAGQIALAQQAWDQFNPHIFDEQAWVETDDLIKAALQAAQAREQQQLARQRIEQLGTEVDALLSASCLRLDLDGISRGLAAVRRESPRAAARLRNQAGARVNECVAQLGAVDPARAVSLQASAVKVLGAVAQVEAAEVDPCSAHYLVGNGRTSGRGGYCLDVVDSELEGPRLVVVPGADGRGKFAISKSEILRSQFNLFCTQTGSCEPLDQPQLPVTGLAPDVVEAYAAWLSERTGYVYRLPTSAEWLAAANTDRMTHLCPDSARESPQGTLLRLGTAADVNELGLVNALSGAWELVKDRRTYQVLHSDGTAAEGSACTLPSSALSSSDVAARVGFRLVREVS